jgi:hypothetical protein
LRIRCVAAKIGVVALVMSLLGGAVFDRLLCHIRAS